MKKDNPLISIKGKIIAGLSLAMVVAVASAFALPAMAANSNSPTADNTNTVQATNQTDDNEVSDAANEASENALLASQVKITEAQAIATVESANPNATVTCDELGNENGTAAYQLTVTAADGSKTEVKVDANTGTILSTSDKEEENDAADPKEGNEQNSDTEESAPKNETEDAALASQVKLSEAQAIAIVEAANPGTSVTCDELGNENGTAAYELKINASDGSKSEAMVDANTGAILASSNADVNYEG